MSVTWWSLDLRGRPDVAEVEHRTLVAVEDLGLDVDHVVTQTLRHRPTSRAVAVLRVRDDVTAGNRARVREQTAEQLARAADGTVVVLPADAASHPLVVGDVSVTEACLAAAEATREGLAGRCVRFPGQDRLTGLVPVRRIVERSAIAEVAGCGGPATDDELVDTRGFVRPVFEAGRLVLRVGPTAGGVLVPDEVAEASRGRAVRS
jgi:hypothetical protein